MIWIFLLLSPFLLIVFIGPPFVRTLKQQRVAAADIFDLEKGDLVLDLGAGDGSVCVDLAEAGYRAIGYELNPFLVMYAWFKCRKHKNATVRWGNMWRVDLPKEAKGVYLFNVGRYMPKMIAMLNKFYPQGIQVASFGFELPGYKIKKTNMGIHLYQLDGGS